MAIILREIEITYWYFFEPDKHTEFLHYLAFGFTRSNSFKIIKRD